MTFRATVRLEHKMDGFRLEGSRGKQLMIHLPVIGYQSVINPYIFTESLLSASSIHKNYKTNANY